jgi:hypothetical protein
MSDSASSRAFRLPSAHAFEAHVCVLLAGWLDLCVHGIARRSTCQPTTLVSCWVVALCIRVPGGFDCVAEHAMRRHACRAVPLNFSVACRGSTLPLRQASLIGPRGLGAVTPEPQFCLQASVVIVKHTSNAHVLAGSCSVWLKVCMRVCFVFDSASQG